MARPLRIQWEGAWYHITSRGQERGAIFWEDEDRRRFLARLARMPERFHTQLHNYVLMNNHYHLVMATGEANLSLGLQWLNGGYSQAFNKRHRPERASLGRAVQGDPGGAGAMGVGAESVRIA